MAWSGITDFGDLDDERRFWKRVNTGSADDCWQWTGAAYIGYGAIRIHGRTLKAHRCAWHWTFGPIRPGLCVCHKCDNPSCCNPKHLFLGTQADNVRDMVSKGRSAAGDKNGSRTSPWRVPRGDSHYSYLHPERVRRGEYATNKLTLASVCAIRIACGEGAQSQRELAKQYQVSQSCVSRIFNHLSWR